MRNTALLAAITLGILMTSASCASTATAPPLGSTAQSITNLAGHWTGTAHIVVNWTQARILPVHLDIQKTRGDLPGSSGRPFEVTAKLDGPLIAAEQVRRNGVIIVFKQTQDQTLRGGLTSTGWDLGGKDSMKLTARDMVLQRQP